LARAGLREGERVRLNVAGNSMAPLCNLGDAVWAEPAVPASLRRGDVIVVRRAGGLVTHRLVALGDGEWYTKGDNARHLDPPVTADAHPSVVWSPSSGAETESNSGAASGPS